MPALLVGPEPHDPTVKTAIDLVRDVLPPHDPFRMWRTHQLRDRVDGRRHAVPLLVLTQPGLWVVHVSTQWGELSGDEEVWRWTFPGGERSVEAPFDKLDDVVRRLREGLDRAGWRRLDVRPLVLLAGDGARIATDATVHRRADLVTLPGAGDPELESIDRRLLRPAAFGRAVARDAAGPIAEALREVGLEAADHGLVIGGYRIGELLVDHEIWQEHRAQALADPTVEARVRTWVLPRVDDHERRGALLRAAKREAEVLERIGQHPYILGLVDTAEVDGLNHPIFEPFEGALTLDHFLRAHPDLPFEARIDVLQQVAEALDHCHRHDVTHRALSPDSVLVRLHDGTIDVRLHRFEGAVARKAEATTLGTRHLSHFSERIDDLYRAPEVHQDPESADASADLFSLGALAYFLFTHTHPGPDLAKRRQRILEDEGLRLWQVRDDLDDNLDEAIGAATRDGVVQREDAVREWVGELFGEPREPTVRTWINGVLSLYREVDASPDDVPVDPLYANPGEALGQGLVVESVLGMGASARVLEVCADGPLRALKVPLPGHERLVNDEAAVLQRIDHPCVVQLDDVVTLSGRTCLLMQHAGESTLADQVRREGTLALDYVRRLGVELLEVLVYLHERGITHRDLKPTNLAFHSAGKQSKQLLVFDFSLAAVPVSRVQMGTPGWRDPFLEDRGEWDPPSDLYAAAAVLHFAMTGERPSWDARARAVRLVENRFDPDLRGALTGFFRRAFAAEVGERFVDAADMARAWDQLFAKDVTSVTTEPDRPLDPRLDRARIDSPIGALGLSARALNALERAGVADVRDLLGLPNNRLSLVRGVGRDTRAEVVRAAEVLRARLGDRDDATVERFLPDAGLLPLEIDQAGLGLTDEVVTALRDAAILTVRDLAETSVERLRRLVAPHGVDLTELRHALGTHYEKVKGPVGEWVHTLLEPNVPSRRTKWEERSALLFGLRSAEGLPHEPAGGRTNAEVAEVLGITPVVLRSTFQNARRHWDKRAEQRDQAIAALGRALDDVGGIAPIPEVAEALLELEAPAQRHEPHAQQQAVALVRFGTEVGIPSPPFVWRRMGKHAWLARSDAALDALQSVASVADRLAPGDPTPLETAKQTLLAAVRAPLDALDPQVLVQRAVEASKRVALSPRFEVYPRGLDAMRAVELSAAVLLPGPGLDAEGVQKRVKARYPEAAELPLRPGLDELMRRVGLYWSSDQHAYVRPGTSGSDLTLATRVTSFSSDVRRDPTQIRIDRFDQALQRSVESGRFRVIQVSARKARDAYVEISRTVPQLVITSLDDRIWTGLLARVAEHGAELDFLLGIDRAGPEHEHWGTFVERFVEPVAAQVIDEVLADRSHPQLLVHPGLFARYGLAELLHRLVDRTENEEGAGVWLLAPSLDDGSGAVLQHRHGDVPVPVFMPAQTLRPPRSWINRSRASR